MLNAVFCFLGGALIANGLPHFINGMSGRAFPTPFARLSGQSESSATSNVLWGACNFAAGYALLIRPGAFDAHAIADVIAAGAGALLLALFLARRFGPLYGGSRPKK